MPLVCSVWFLYPLTVATLNSIATLKAHAKLIELIALCKQLQQENSALRSQLGAVRSKSPELVDLVLGGGGGVEGVLSDSELFAGGDTHDADTQTKKKGKCSGCCAIC
jgi:hypothetical protein